MTEKAEAIIAEVLALPPLERTQLIERLYDSLRSTEESEIEQAWVAVAEQRIDRYIAGDLEAVPYEQLKRALSSNDR